MNSDCVLSARQVADIMGIGVSSVLAIEGTALIKFCVGCLRDPELRGLMIACLDMEEVTDESEQGDADRTADERPGDDGRGKHDEDRLLFGDQSEVDDEGG